MKTLWTGARYKSGMSIGTKIRAGREHRRLSQRELADALGVSVQAVSNWENGKNHPGYARLNMIANMLRVAVGSLSDDNVELSLSNQRDGRIPVVGVDDILMFSPFVVNNSLSEIDPTGVWITGDLKIIGQGFAVVIEDDSMSPFLNVGDLALFDSGVPAEVGDVVAGASLDGDRSVAWIRRMTSLLPGSKANKVGQLTFKPDNPAYPDIVSSAGSGLPMFAGTLVERRNRRISRRT